MVEQQDATEHLENLHQNNPSVNNIESELSKYSLNDSDFTNFLQDKSQSQSQSSLSSSGPSSSIDSSLPTTSETTFHKDQEKWFKEITNGLIHGHIHKFQNFTYIHGHIHTNDPIQPPPSSSSSSSALPTIDTTTKDRRRRRSSHRHSNEPESLQFADCQHFEFLNCHDENSILNSEIECNENHEDCQPKIVEICCDNTHNSNGNPIPNFPSCTDHEQLDKEVVEKNDNLTKDPNCGIDECIDIKCDLDTCDFDELYCKYCEDIDQITNESTSAGTEQQQQQQQIKIEPTQNTNYLDMLNHDIISGQNTSTSTTAAKTHESTSKTKNNDAPVNFTNPLNCINPQCNSSKRHFEEDDHQHTLDHHLHHHSFQHSDNHHHHRIQIHDHQPKKIKKNIHKTDELINFEWNFKNQGAKCEWENCSTTLDNSSQLQNHIVEDHLLSEYAVPPTNAGSFECEWKNCDYSGFDLFSLVNHINDTHGFQYDFDINNFFKKEDQQPLQQINFPTPSSDSNDNSSNSSSTTINVKKEGKQPSGNDDVEETVCKWAELDSNGQILHQCDQKFQNAEELTEHLIHDHVGSGKSEYTCLWANCSRNHRNFNQRQKIIRHLHVHTRYKPFVCKVCNHSFAVESMLEQHMRTHSGEKPYKCKICDKHFATSSSLSIHLRTHTGEKPLLCKYPGCGKRFSESSNLTKHIKTHEKFFKCDCCSKSFSKEKQLQSHMTKYHT